MTSAAARRFPVPSVLYVSTGGTAGLCDSHGLAVVQELLGHMTGHPIFLHQIPRAVDVCRKYLVDQYPWLEALQPTNAQAGDARKLAHWVAKVIAARGETLLVSALPGGAYAYMSPVDEFCEQLADGVGATAAAGPAE
ncbi:hypothetical protein [Mycolicibacterium canariasense]|uniref:DUF7736 domain-containing protein n=1 Tax=Mycolicibacterium canariasense TaxID=228230 RepID=UPI000A156CFD|nr:hypothetical protein [Mycolicibacterium canariasense]MCV7208347.1 hypothetical protein [Mycolicibacterium canariasense]ORV13535.1 hypothetical protein AWB94_04745 [Mycolicibacterium canariasense]